MWSLLQASVFSTEWTKYNFKMAKLIRSFCIKPKAMYSMWWLGTPSLWNNHISREPICMRPQFWRLGSQIKQISMSVSLLCRVLPLYYQNRNSPILSVIIGVTGKLGNTVSTNEVLVLMTWRHFQHSYIFPNNSPQSNIDTCKPINDNRALLLHAYQI